MTFFPEPIHPSEGRQDEEIIVNPIEADKKGENEDFKSPPSGNNGLFYGSMLLLMKRVASLISETRQTEIPDAIALDTSLLKSCLEELKAFDQDENPHFCQELSLLWQRLLKHVQRASRVKTKTDIDLSKLKIVLSDIDHYPPNQEDKLGFYLTQYGEEGKLPLPLKEIFKKLHADYQTNRMQSILEKWTELLTSK